MLAAHNACFKCILLLFIKKWHSFNLWAGQVRDGRNLFYRRVFSVTINLYSLIRETGQPPLLAQVKVKQFNSCYILWMHDFFFFFWQNYSWEASLNNICSVICSYGNCFHVHLRFVFTNSNSRKLTTASFLLQSADLYDCCTVRECLFFGNPLLVSRGMYP